MLAFIFDSVFFAAPKRVVRNKLRSVLSMPFGESVLVFCRFPGKIGKYFSVCIKRTQEETTFVCLINFVFGIQSDSVSLIHRLFISKIQCFLITAKVVKEKQFYTLHSKGSLQESV